MDFKFKYLKYKNKYFKLKKIKGGKSNDINLLRMKAITDILPDGTPKLNNIQMTFYHPFRIPTTIAVFTNKTRLPALGIDEWIEPDPITHESSIFINPLTDGVGRDIFRFIIKIKSPVGIIILYFMNFGDYQIFQIKNERSIKIVPINVTNYMLSISRKSSELRYDLLNPIDEPLHRIEI